MVKNKKNIKTRRRTRKFVTKNRQIIGGTVYGVGSFGAVTGDPPVPYKKTFEQTGKSIKSVSTKINSTLRKTLKNNKYVSKIFFDESTTTDVINSIGLLESVSGKNYKKVFNPYLVLPVEYHNHKLVAEIDQTEYLSPAFQSDKYWSRLDGTIDEDSRSKLSNATKQVWYPKAAGDLEHLKLTTYTEFVNFLHNFRNIVKGIQVLHDTGIVHHDLKPLNILTFKSDNSNSLYKISDLDTLKKLDDFTSDNIKKEHITRLFNTWGYEYFPTCITLLTAIFKSVDNNIDPVYSNSTIHDGFNVEFNKQASVRVGKETNDLLQHLTKILPPSSFSINAIIDIQRNKYGAAKPTDSELADESGNISTSKFKLLTQFNSRIASLLNSATPSLSIIDKRNILLKYVDVYSLGRSILEMLEQYITKSSEIFNDKMKQHIDSIIDFLYSILTYAYFEDEIYKKDILSLYEEHVIYNTQLVSIKTQSPSIQNNLFD